MKTTEEKKLLINKHAPHSPLFKNSALAFLSGGIICLMGEGLFALYSYLGADKNLSGASMISGFMGMMGSFTILRLTSMISMANISFTKEELLKMNKKLNKIRKPKNSK